jgi:hypothetical protein
MLAAGQCVMHSRCWHAGGCCGSSENEKRTLRTSAFVRNTWDLSQDARVYDPPVEHLEPHIELGGGVVALVLTCGLNVPQGVPGAGLRTSQAVHSKDWQLHLLLSLPVKDSCQNRSCANNREVLLLRHDCCRSQVKAMPSHVPCPAQCQHRPLGYQVL